jgi:hypothetical protein
MRARSRSGARYDHRDDDRGDGRYEGRRRHDEGENRRPASEALGAFGVGLRLLRYLELLLHSVDENADAVVHSLGRLGCFPGVALSVCSSRGGRVVVERLAAMGEAHAAQSTGGAIAGVSAAYSIWHGLCSVAVMQSTGTPTDHWYISPEQVCELVPGLTVANLKDLRASLKGPAFYKPTQGKITVYLEAEVRARVEGTRVGTRDQP